MFNLFEKKDKEDTKKQECVVKIESDDDAFYNSRKVFLGRKIIGEIIYKNDGWNFECRINQGTYLGFVDCINEKTLTLILEEIKRLNAIDL